MPRFCLTLEYNGGYFSGWQYQATAPSVQEALQKAIAAMTGEQVVCAAAGRTDQGVHATGQVAHMDLEKPWPPYMLLRGLNHHLKGKGLVVLHVCEAPNDFHARFSAQSRTYIYRLLTRPSPCLLHAQQCWWIAKPLDVQAMNQAASFLEGTHDFSSFRHKNCQSQSPVKTLQMLSVTSQKEGWNTWIEIKAFARSFLHRQVRMMVGALVYVGLGKWEPPHVQVVLEGKKTLPGAMTAPAYGLYLTHASYDPDPRNHS